MTTLSPHRLLQDLAARLESAEAEFHRALWESQIQATPENEERRAEFELEVRRIKGDPVAYGAVEAALREEIHDPVLRRQLEILRLSLTANQMDDEQRAELVQLATMVEGRFAAHRAKVDGSMLSANEVEEVLRTSDDQRLRQKVWAASKQVGGLIAEGVRELVRVRNTAAHAHGYPDYYRMSLELQEITEEWLFELLDDLDELTRPVFESWKADLDRRLSERFQTRELFPWHYADPFFQSLPPDGRVSLDGHLGHDEAPELARRTFAAWGIDLSKVIDASDLYPRDLKSQHAFCLDVDRSGTDVRILANVVAGENWVEVMLHESGHAAYDISIDPSLPWVLRRAAHTFVTEAIALLCGGLVRDPSWLTTIVGVDEEAVARLATPSRRAAAAQKLVFARWGLVMAHFERELYADPEADLEARWWELVEQFQLVAPPPDPPADSWASKVHLAVAPAYYHNYLLGDLLGAQLRAAIEHECGAFVANAAAGEFLIERVFRHGQLMRWDSLIESATGRALSASDFAAALAPVP